MKYIREELLGIHVPKVTLTGRKITMLTMADEEPPCRTRPMSAYEVNKVKRKHKQGVTP